MTEELTVIDPIEDLERFIEMNPNRKEACEFPTLHRFTTGLYSRTVELREGETVISRIHKTEHQFVISKGVVKIWSREHGLQVVQSPFLGITKADTRRAVQALSDTVWTTFHPTDKTDIEEIEKDLFA